MKTIDLNRQSGMIYACSSCIFDVNSRVSDSHFFPFFFFFCCDYWFSAHAVTIGSMLIYKFWGHLTEG